ncbi:hypothetical protein [uncultured Anaerococcus sp.]|uniref:hypothetical protein n=1 Tax=uncultured Anaerococcus sp. TaxID=293428 RepID=UPI00280BDC63|nr:hypothetical protein [uncultured Anaerococcus sp.]MDU5149179.1 hypothetical protein [Anaerococcus prevotii]
MGKKILAVLFVLLSISSCGNKNSNDKVNVRVKTENKVENKTNTKNDTDDKKEVAEKSDKNLPKENDEAQAFFKTIEAKKFAIPSVASKVESIFLYNDGYFDGMIKSGNGDAAYIGLYNGKLDYVEKIDDLTYKVKLAKLEMETPTGQEEQINMGGIDINVEYVDWSFFKEDNIGSEYLIHLPKTKVSSLDDTNRQMLEMVDKYIKDDNANIFFIEALDDKSGLMYEFIREN